MVMEERWEVVGDTYCNANLLRVTEPDGSDQLSFTKFLMHIKAIIRRFEAQLPNATMDIDVDMLLTEKNWNVEEKEASIEFEYDEEYDDVAAMKSISDALSGLQVPVQTHSSLIDRILFQASNASRNCEHDHHKVLHMAVEVDLYVAEKV
uniref:uncharacterized protein LOC105351247 n=1 Tax=Fragaria vesca subsp. vesca TaxID=101020 RepID=UPI0005C9AB1E|nr:PREDICTED: uncharacterized protein LOC105351247 [Fragaria vesca subsp. vesca]